VVYDFDESQSTDTFDGTFKGMGRTIPFALIASISTPHGQKSGSPAHATVTLRSGDNLLFERTGDLGERTTGVLVFTADNQRPEYVRWSDIARIDFDAPANAAAKPE
jgi:hypothetical protein